MSQYDAMKLAAKTSVAAKIEVLETQFDIFDRPEFICALGIFAKCQGKVVVSGMGKSGHIARKIAATFQSTGQRAYFLHPGEAAHGDMGVIGPDDCLLLISNSGETDELIKVALFGQQFHANEIVVITGKYDSALAALANSAIIYQMEYEGDPLNIAPMASTCMQLAIGDALAAALMTCRGFSREDFARFHHGGYIGRVSIDAE